MAARKTNGPNREPPQKTGTAGKLAKVGLLSGAALGMSTGDVMAGIIDFTVGFQDVYWGTSNSNTSSFDLNSMGGTDIKLFGSNDGANFAEAGVIGFGMAAFQVLTNGSGFVQRLNFGDSIGTQIFVDPGAGGIDFLSVMEMMNMYMTNGSFALSGSYYFGFQFMSGTNTFNAWAKVRIDGDGMGGMFPLMLTFIEGAYDDDPTMSIQAGITTLIPEPGTAGLTALGMGVLGVHGMRRRKQQRAKAEARADGSSR
ncbi:MAG: PEP-CTERM sorting domain-containing protein [Myxococcales bacterium]|nr:PEP-CTERM sorting domain-containing protein [Myxococcales bacterium]